MKNISYTLMVAVHSNHLCSPLRIFKPILICLYFLCFSSGYNAWRDRTKPSHILAKMCSDAGFGAPHYRLHQGKVTVNKKDFYLSDGRFTHTPFSLLIQGVEALLVQFFGWVTPNLLKIHHLLQK